MRFFGTDNELKVLKENTENVIDPLLMTVFNEGFASGYQKCTSNINELYNQANAALDQDIDPRFLPKENNLFLQLLVRYAEIMEQKQLASEAQEVSSIEETT